MADFDIAIATVIEHEGGFVDHPDDPGGATNYGISLRFLQSEYGLDFDLDSDGDLDADDIKKMTMEQAIAIYHEKWWDKYDYGRIGNQLIATKVFDLAVNMGAKQAHKLMQRACLACGRVDIKEDGVLGPATVGAINLLPAIALQASLRSEAAGYYRLIAAQHPDFSAFISGWLRRAYD